MELTILMPCLNEAETIEKCIQKAMDCMKENGIDGEVLIADNGSSDGSDQLAKNMGARVVYVEERGYGAALIAGIDSALGDYCIMGDADDSYDFSDLMPFLSELRKGADLVMGNRFQGGIEKGAMPFLHKYLGTPVISWLGRLFYKNKIGDFNCGMRGFNIKKIREIGCCSIGMEFASEMIVKASLYGLNITEVPTTLSVDGRSRRPYLKTWQDGWRHLKFLLVHTPNWLFLYPGIFLTALGIILMALLELGSLKLLNVSLDINTMLYGGAFIIVGVNAIFFSIYTKIFAISSGYIPKAKVQKYRNVQSEKIIMGGLVIFICGLLMTIFSVCRWKNVGFGELIPQEMMRITIPATVLLIEGVQLIFGGFFTAILKIETK